MQAIFARRSLGRLMEPAPSDDELRRILEAAVAAPDHERLRPWRFTVLRGAAKDAFGRVLVDALLARQPDAEPVAVEKERTKLGRAPLIVVVAAVRQESAKVPWEEQLAAVAAATQNLLLAATELGYGSMWRTGDPAYDPRVKAALGLDEHDAVVGFVYLGTPSGGTEKPPNRPVLDGLVTEWSP
jgi:nitroreductase